MEPAHLKGGGVMKAIRSAVVGLALLLSIPANGSAQTLDKKVLSFAAAEKIAAAAADAARARGVGVVIAVVDDGGHLILLHRLDDAQVASVNVGIGKARTAAIYRRPSREFEEQIRGGPDRSPRSGRQHAAPGWSANPAGWEGDRGDRGER